jgi:hypothetical protein
VFSFDGGLTFDLSSGADVHFITFVNTPVPEPSSLLLLISSLLVVAAFGHCFANGQARHQTRRDNCFAAASNQ